MDKTIVCISFYKKYKNLKKVGQIIGIPWQTVYWYLKKANIKVCGDKRNYGSATDKLAAKAERLFNKIVPSALDQNKEKFQSKVDFKVHNYMVDIKASNPKITNKKTRNLSWAFSIKKQELHADFLVCFGFRGNKYEVFLIPKEAFSKYMTISIPCSGKGKWWKYVIKAKELNPFFKKMKKLS